MNYIVQSHVKWGDFDIPLSCCIFDDKMKAVQFYYDQCIKIVDLFKKHIPAGNTIDAMAHSEKEQYEVWSEENPNEYYATLRLTQRLINSTVDGLPNTLP